MCYHNSTTGLLQRGQRCWAVAVPAPAVMLRELPLPRRSGREALFFSMLFLSPSIYFPVSPKHQQQRWLDTVLDLRVEVWCGSGLLPEQQLVFLKVALILQQVQGSLVLLACVCV